MAKLAPALPFWVSLLLAPVAAYATVQGGWALLLFPLSTFVAAGVIDRALGIDETSADPATPEAELFWHRLVTMIWPPLQALMLFGAIAYAARADHYAPGEIVALATGLGIVTGAIGIVYAHELFHQSNRLERFLGDALMAMTLYGHFRSEHLLVHHRYVGTPRDAVTARYNETVYAFIARVLPASLKSAWAAETALLARKGLPPWHRGNPFWRYAALQAGFLLLAILLGGWTGLAIFLIQAIVAVVLLEMINYIEHYGLTRKHLGEGRYEHAQAHHSWNASHRGSNWYLINLQRHSDHHTRPDRRYPLLQHRGEAPQLPFGYSLMGLIAFVPPLFLRMMNPRVRAWRKRHYPEITDWRPYKEGALPLPR